MIYTINNCIRAFGYTNFNKLVEDKGSIDGLKEYVRANGYADIAVAEDTELLLVDVNGKTWHTGCYGAVIEPEPERDYLCFTSTGDSTVAMTQNGTPNTSAGKLIQYKLNDGQWQTWDLSAVTLHDGDKMYLKSDDEIPIGELNYIYKYFVMTGSIAASGNIMSLLNFSDTLPDFAFLSLFKECGSLTQAPKLPATKLATSCYESMFYYCTSLTQAPELPATTLAVDCYFTMFGNCYSLTQAPALPATTLQSGCYGQMFISCSHLTNAPALPATTLQSRCYYAMFKYCYLLTQAPELPATTLADSCYSSMFESCETLTQAPELPATTLVGYCYNGMFFNCESLTTAPELPATDLTTYCYNQMFGYCSNLNYVKALFTTNPTTGTYLDGWLDGVSATGTFVKNSAATWTNEQAGIPTGWTVQVEGGVTPEPEPERDYLCFTSTGDSTVAMQQKGTPNTSANKVIQYKLNNGQWQTWDLSAVSLADGDKMYIKSDDEIPVSEDYEGGGIYKKFVMTGSIAASGNIMSLINFSNTINASVFCNLFYGCSSLTTAPELPATTLSTACYYGMFGDCTSLINAPALPATTSPSWCYSGMFYGCSSLTTAPELPATTLSRNCYERMFYGCTSLTSAPELPATTLDYACYESMFYGCTSLTTAPELPATTLSRNCYESMFQSCSSLTTAPELPATTLDYGCYSSMFSYCTSLTTAPALPVTTLTINCYAHMFESCGSLVHAPELPATTLAMGCYYNMFRGCGMLNYVKAMFTDISDSNCLTEWIAYVSSTGTFVKNAAATWANDEAGIPSGWTVQTASPDK